MTRTREGTVERDYGRGGNNKKDGRERWWRRYWVRRKRRKGTRWGRRVSGENGRGRSVTYRVMEGEVIWNNRGGKDEGEEMEEGTEGGRE